VRWRTGYHSFDVAPSPIEVTAHDVHAYPITDHHRRAACAAIIILAGYDQTVYGAVLPVFVRDPSWHLSKVNAGYGGSAAFLGC